MSLANGRNFDDMTHLMRVLESGFMLRRFTPKRKDQRKVFQVKLETRQLIWTSNIGSRPEGVGNTIFYHCMFLL